jgi:DNA-binding winged helix-turn-helix (wHTH) protein
MANPDGDNAKQQLTFGRYVLDLRRSCLLFDGHEIALRPQTFSVLCFLAQHPDRAVTSDELLAAVWPDLVVPEDAVAKSIDELQRALGESGAKLVSVSSAGYRFEADAAPHDRRRSRRGHPLRWRWIYGILAPLALLLTFVVLWLTGLIQKGSS